MSLDINVPQSGQSLGQTRDKIRNNFVNYNTVMSVNHVTPNSAGQGKHKFCEFPSQGIDGSMTSGSPATSSNEVAVYCKTGAATAGSVPQLYLQKENQAANAADILMSRLDKGVSNALSGYSFLPGGLIIQWGIDQFLGTAVAKTVTFPIPFTTASYNIQVTGVGFNNIFHADTNTTTTVIVSKNQAVGADQQFWWMAIGS